MKPAFLDRLLNALALLVLAGISVFLAARWQALPSRVPMHYNAFGEIDRWGSKASLAALLGVAWVLYGLLSLIGRFPALWNTGGLQITEANQARVYAALLHLLSSTKLLMALVFGFLALCSILARPLPAWFMPVTLALLLGNLGGWMLRAYRSQ